MLWRLEESTKEAIRANKGGRCVNTSIEPIEYKRDNSGKMMEGSTEEQIDSRSWREKMMDASSPLWKNY